MSESIPGSSEGPWGLLRRLREAMEKPLPTQERLDLIVSDIAEHMKADVCSAYFKRASQELELFATKGLNPEAVHQTRLRMGEGLVGLIALTNQLVNLYDGPNHPNFVYRPETGEELYKSFLGVPILRGGRLLGVIVVQNSSERIYIQQDVEAMQTVAMVLAEQIAAGEVLGRDGGLDEELSSDAPQHFHGLALTDGIAMGHAVLHQPRVEITRLVAEDLDTELLRLNEAVDLLRASIDEMVMSEDLKLSGDPRDVMEAYRMFAHDKGWLERMHESVRDGLTAEAAVEKVLGDTRARLSRSPDPYLRERLNDFDDLSNRLLRHLIGSANLPELPEDAIVVARFMGPAELLDYDQTRLKGVVLEEGSATAHVTIVARALGIPMVGRAREVVDRVEPGNLLIADGEHGDVHVRPQADIVEVYGHKIELRTERQAKFASDKDLPSVTRDGEDVQLDINAGLLVDLPLLEETGAAGIGLFRTELQFLMSATLPRLTVQTEIYRKVLDAAGDRRVVFRTVDLGSDKVPSYMATDKEENPALGWRAVRLALDRPGLLRYQIRAMLTAAKGRDLDLMFPMIAEVSEFVAARALVDKEIDRLGRLGRDGPRSIRVGSMLEVPSLAWQLDALLPLVDFISVGSNDLFQFLFASDRSNPRLSGRYDLLSPPALAFLQNVVTKAEAHQVALSLCGEMAGDPLEAMVLIGLGFRRISMPPTAVGPVKAMVRTLDTRATKAFVAGLLDGPDHSVRERLAAFAREHDVVIS